MKLNKIRSILKYLVFYRVPEFVTIVLKSVLGYKSRGQCFQILHFSIKRNLEVKKKLI